MLLLPVEMREGEGEDSEGESEVSEGEGEVSEGEGEGSEGEVSEGEGVTCQRGEGERLREDEREVVKYCR